MVMEKSLSAEWTRIRGRLRAEYGEAAYRSWLKPLTLCGFADNRVKLSAPTRFMRDWVDSQYGDRLARLWKGEIEEIEGVDLILEGVMSAAPAASGDTAPACARPAAPARDASSDTSVPTARPRMIHIVNLTPPRTRTFAPRAHDESRSRASRLLRAGK